MKKRKSASKIQAFPHRGNSQGKKTTIAVAGNPNVGKSTLFNALTGMHQHTGNWTGKTVGSAEGYCYIDGREFRLIDVPGTYSLSTHSPEEEIAKEVLVSDDVDAILVVCDATSLERSLILAMQIRDLGKPTIICINLLDEARRKGITVNLSVLEERLGIPVVGAIARKRHGLDDLKQILLKLTSKNKSFAVEKCEKPAEEYVVSAERLCQGTYFVDREKSDRRDRLLDRLFTGKKTAYPIMLFFLLFIFWLTIVGANYPSEILSKLLLGLGKVLSGFLSDAGCPEFVRGLFIDGAYCTLARIVSVMLPPMAIFFPLFTLLEDFGYLPRVAFNLDKPFCKCKSCGKQALTMCMGFGCNAAGVVGCRIIDSPRERMIAILTNSLVPCNGRFPLLITLLTVFFIGSGGGLGASLASAVMLTALIVLSVAATLLISKILSSTFLKGSPSAFTLELPPYRPPQFGKVIIRSVFDRTLFVLGRAVVTAIPAGIILWLMANLKIGDETLLSTAASALDPIARIIGLDGVILISFILALPANEIVIPIIIMAYAGNGTAGGEASIFELKELLTSNGWTATTALCTMLFSLFHWPCATTLLTIKKETGSLKWALAAAAIPTLLGIALCAAVNILCRIIC